MHMEELDVGGGDWERCANCGEEYDVGDDTGRCPGEMERNAWNCCNGTKEIG